MPNWPQQQGIASWIPATPPPQATFTIPTPSTPAQTYTVTSVAPDAGEIRWAVATPSPALAPEFVQSYRNLFEDLLPKKKKVEKPFDWVAFLMFWADLATAHEKKVYCIAS